MSLSKKTRYLILFFISSLTLVGCYHTSEQSLSQSQIHKSSPSPSDTDSISNIEDASNTPSTLETPKPEPTEPEEPSYPPLSLVATDSLPAPTFIEGTPVALHGQLKVEDIHVKDVQNEIFQLRGISTHGVQWFSKYLNTVIFDSLRADFNMNAIRLCLYTDYSAAYLENQTAYTKILEQGIDAATKSGLYILIDWHILEDEDPMLHKDDAANFFEYFSKKYSNYPNIIYEICNEPNGNRVTWSDNIKPYAEHIIPIIRKNDPDSIIIVGTPHWCQSPLSVVDDPLEEDNLLYAFHFYASTHGSILRSQLETAITKKRLPIIVSEFGTCEATGSGFVNEEQTMKWIGLLNTYNISWLNWSLCDKEENSAFLLPNTSADEPISDNSLTESGKLIKKLILNPPIQVEK